MSVKKELLELFENNRDRYISGNEIAESFDVSRTAVWKTVKSLINEGHIIEAAGNKGYRMLAESDVLSEAGIRKYIKNGDDFTIEVYDEVGSTNDVLKDKASKGEGEGTVIAASGQTGGKGRMGRSFSSPTGTGVYFSLLLRPEIPLEEMTLITTAAAVAVCRAAERMQDIKAQIKWVNDIYVRGRKTAGILTEASFGGETGTLDHVVLGIGINLYEPEGGFSEELAFKAGAMFENKVDDGRNKMIAFTLEEFYSIYRNFGDKKFVGEYIKRSFVIGKNVMIRGRGREICSGEVLGIDPYCRLEVIMEDGTVEMLNSGEISILPEGRGQWKED